MKKVIRGSLLHNVRFCGPVRISMSEIEADLGAAINFNILSINIRLEELGARQTLSFFHRSLSFRSRAIFFASIRSSFPSYGRSSNSLSFFSFLFISFSLDPKDSGESSTILQDVCPLLWESLLKIAQTRTPSNSLSRHETSGHVLERTRLQTVQDLPKTFSKCYR